MNQVRARMQARQVFGQLSDKFPRSPGMDQAGTFSVRESDAIGRLDIREHFKIRDSVRPDRAGIVRNAYRTRNTQPAKGIGDAENVHRTVSGEVAVAYENNVHELSRRRYRHFLRLIAGRSQAEVRVVVPVSI